MLCIHLQSGVNDYQNESIMPNLHMREFTFFVSENHKDTYPCQNEGDAPKPNKTKPKCKTSGERVRVVVW